MIRSIRANLVHKDLHFFRKQIPGYIASGVFAVIVASLPGAATYFYAGGVLLVTVLVTLAMSLPILTVLAERRDQTLPFLMSLPITPADYSWSKLVFNLATYLGIWSILLGACIVAILSAEHLSDGLIPFVLIVFVGCAAYAVLILGTALVRDDLDRTVRAVIFWNLILQGTIYCAATNDHIHAAMNGNAIVWSPQALAFLLGELLVIAAAFYATVRLQARKSQLV